VADAPLGLEHLLKAVFIVTAHGHTFDGQPDAAVAVFNEIGGSMEPYGCGSVSIGDEITRSWPSLEKEFFIMTTLVI